MSNNTNEIFVIKRDGSSELLNYDKINKVLLWATDKISGVYASDVAMNAELQIYNNITTDEIHRVLIQSANDMISEKMPNYQYVAANLTNYLLRKNVFNVTGETDMPSLKSVIDKNIENGVYDAVILDNYTEEEIDKIDTFVKHDRDYTFTYAGIQQLIDKYLIKHRNTGELYETPQYMYILIAMTLFTDAPDRMKKIKSYYNDISTFKSSLPTPIMSGVRTPNRQYSSCFLTDVGDNLKSIYSTNTAVGFYSSKRAGIGLNMGRIRAIGDDIRGGEVTHTGLIPFLKMFEGTTKSCTQNSIRTGSTTCYVPFWHKEISDVIVLKNNKGTDDNRVRKMDYAIQFCKLFYKRFLNNEDVTLFSPGDVPDLMEAFGDNEKFNELYEMYERKTSINKKKIPARDLMNAIAQERIGTGRIYIMNIDHANEHSSFNDKIWMSNLCVEVVLPTSPINHIDDGKRANKIIKIKADRVSELEIYMKENNDIYTIEESNKLLYKTDLFKVLDYDSKYEINEIDKYGYTYLERSVERVYGEKPGEIAICTLSALNLGAIKDLSEIEDVVENIVRSLDYVITHQDYPVEAAKKMLKRRSLGIGITNLAYFLAKNDVTYDCPEALELVDEYMEYIQFYAIKASVELAKENGPCEWFHRTKYAKGILPIDTYSKSVDTIVSRKHSLDWEWLRQEVLTHGMRNSTLTAIMPCESSSLVSNSTNGMEPIRSLITIKKSKQGLLKMVVPEMKKLKNKYTFAFDMKGNKGITNIQSVIQKWIDQGISANHYYDFVKYEDGNLPISTVAKDLLYFYKMGGKQLYYANSNDNKTDDFSFMDDKEKKENAESDSDGFVNSKSISFDDSSSCDSGGCEI